jgi:CheY-like chemotaxis protein/glycine cleavage system H lipoate-binding protein
MKEQAKVLVVDDEEVVLQSVRKILESTDDHEFAVDTVLSPQEGLALINRFTYDIVITDLMMPGIDGLAFIDRVRENSPDCRIIMITGYATMRTALQALRKGAFDYIAKPFTKREMLTVVENALDADYVSQVDRQRARESRATQGTREFRSFLNQTYVRIGADGATYFGVESEFLADIGEPLDVEVRRVGEDVLQGFPFGAITNAEMKTFNLRAPVSGRIVQVNQEALDDVSVILEDPCGRGWLIQIDPKDLENEIAEL